MNANMASVLPGLSFMTIPRRAKDWPAIEMTFAILEKSSEGLVATTGMTKSSKKGGQRHEVATFGVHWVVGVNPWDTWAQVVCIQLGD